MAAPKHAYPIGKPARDSGDPKQIAKLADIPRFKCDSCGHEGAGESLLGVDESETMWCPCCRSSAWSWI